MAPKMNKSSPMHQELVNTSGTTSISPEAMQAWGRIPQQYKTEIIEAVERPSAAGGAETKSVKVGTKTFTVRRVSSGFRVVYDPSNGRNTIVSVMTPREARLVKG
ncbi:hypothetical protein GCM10027277_03760 [Pseudoduganella ginsengisoli]|uniref:Type II toxin-antitoxin system RelE/ParE family toxin n=1 Tax=Pseudoduganella ginsengisoli TaxID=1462440 RepID=A0A6L6Q4N7_9BURK|nr:hypothetical protein [Pseudoduganella ginsengisoli]MTW04813.1 hypothetical protein [Pseudoduganella ginsengisoli]